jgi:hypothetical protein
MVVHAQRISAEGIALWGDGGIVVAAIPNGQGVRQEIISDGAGGFIIAWDTGSSIPDTTFTSRSWMKTVTRCGEKAGYWSAGTRRQSLSLLPICSHTPG